MLNFKFNSLAALYAANVLDGGSTIDEVPEVIRPVVQQIMGMSAGTDTAEPSDESAQ